MHGRTLTQGTPWKVILSFMFPVFMGLLLQQLYNTVDTIVVGNFAGEDPLAAVGASGVLTMVFLALANGFSAGSSVLIAQLFGAGEEKRMRRQASSALLVMLAMGVFASIAGILISRFSLKYILATPESLLDMADTYFKLYAAGLVFQFGYNIVAAILRGVGDSKATLYFQLIASALNVVLDIVFVYNLRMGVAGAAIATDIAQAGSFMAAVWYMMKKYPLFRWRLRELTFEWELALRALKTGFPMALQQLMVSVGFVFIQRAVNSYGEAMTASFTVAQKIETYMGLPANALMTTQATYTAQNMGAGRMERVQTGAKHTVIISEAISICILTVVFIFARPIVTAFGLGPEAIGYCPQVHPAAGGARTHRDRTHRGDHQVQRSAQRQSAVHPPADPGGDRSVLRPPAGGIGVGYRAPACGKPPARAGKHCVTACEPLYAPIVGGAGTLPLPVVSSRILAAVPLYGERAFPILSSLRRTKRKAG